MFCYFISMFSMIFYILFSYLYVLDNIVYVLLYVLDNIFCYILFFYLCLLTAATKTCRAMRYYNLIAFWTWCTCTIIFLATTYTYTIVARLTNFNHYQ